LAKTGAQDAPGKGTGAALLPDGKSLKNCAFRYGETSDLDCFRAYNKADSKCEMTEPTDAASFEKIVQWAYSTLPEEIRNLPDFPGIQLADEPAVEMFEKMSKRSNCLRALNCWDATAE
jgi:hypothetical protein